MKQMINISWWSIGLFSEHTWIIFSWVQKATLWINLEMTLSINWSKQLFAFIFCCLLIQIILTLLIYLLLSQLWKECQTCWEIQVPNEVMNLWLTFLKTQPFWSSIGHDFDSAHYWIAYGNSRQTHLFQCVCRGNSCSVVVAAM